MPPGAGTLSQDGLRSAGAACPRRGVNWINGASGMSANEDSGVIEHRVGFFNRPVDLARLAGNTLRHVLVLRLVAALAQALELLFNDGIARQRPVGDIGELFGLAPLPFQ